MQVASVASQAALQLVVVATLMTNAAQGHVTKSVILVSHQYQVVQAASQIVQAAVVLCVSVAITVPLVQYPAKMTIVPYIYCIRVSNFVATNLKFYFDTISHGNIFRHVYKKNKNYATMSLLCRTAYHTYMQKRLFRMINLILSTGNVIYFLDHSIKFIVLVYY